MVKGRVGEPNASANRYFKTINQHTPAEGGSTWKIVCYRILGPGIV